LRRTSAEKTRKNMAERTVTWENQAEEKGTGRYPLLNKKDAEQASKKTNALKNEGRRKK